MALGYLCGVEDLLASGSQLVWSVAEELLRKCYTEGLVPCRRFLQTWCRVGDVYQMTEGRQCQVLLLDDRQLELLVQPKLLSRDLLDLVSSHFNLKEKEYFGISFTDETGQTNWLQLNRRVLDHDFNKKPGPLELKFQVSRFHFESFSGDWGKSDCGLIPGPCLTHLSLSVCSEDRVIEHYKTLEGLSRGKAIVQLWWLLRYCGVGAIIFHWKQLENLYFREKKFAVEVNDPQRRAASKRTFGQSGQAIHSWYASHSLIKTIWAMAISQHQFYLDRKQSKAKIATAKSLGDIAMDLTEIAAPRISKLVSVESKDQLIMASTGSLVSAGSADSEVSEELKKEKISELKKKEKNLQDLLTQKLNELKKICLREAELTGKLPKEYPLASGEKPPAIRKRIGTAFKLDDLFPYDADPHLRNLESRFALQQKIVEAAKKLANETELCKTVKKKRRRNYVDAMKRFQEIENEINDYRVKTGKVPTQRASLIISDLSSLSDKLNFSAFLSLKLSFVKQCFNLYFRSNYAEVQDPYPYLHRDALSTHSSPYYPASKQPRDSRSMPPTPQLTRNAFSSIQLRCEDDAPHHFRQRSGSLESQSLYPSETDAPEPAFTIAPPARRSNSTEVLDDVSSHTSQSSSEYCAHSRARDRHRRRKGNVYANTGSMPNLAQNDAHCYGYQPRARPTTTAYYVTGYPCYPEPEPYMNGGGYVYENDMEGQYNVNPSYHTPAYPAHDPYGRGYGQDDMDNLSQNPYATLRQARNRPPSRNENSSRHMQKAMVAEHLRGWYNRNMGHKQAAYEYERVPQQSVAYRIAPSGYGFSDRATSYSSGEPFGVLMMSYVDVSQADTHMSSPVDSFDSEDQTLYWHEDSKPGTIV
uniref:FERM domain containing 4Ba n=1 Tax=Astyanax mexicanus TaxID=7994 RepID=A0A8B9H2C3_ASTMX